MKLKELKEKSINYDKSEKGIKLNKILKRILITGSLCIIVSIIYLVGNLLTNAKWYDYITPPVLFIFGIVFILKSKQIKEVEVNIFNYNEKYKGKKKGAN